MKRNLNGFEVKQGEFIRLFLEAKYQSIPVEIKDSEKYGAKRLELYMCPKCKTVKAE